MDACCMRMQSCKIVLGGNYTEIFWRLKRKIFWRLLLRHFRMTITAFQMLCNEIGPLFSQVMPSHRTKSHDFIVAHVGIYSVNVFPSPIIHINSFLHKTKTTSSECKIFFCKIRGCFFEIFLFHHSFLMQYFKMRIKTGWWKHSLHTFASSKMTSWN